MPKIRARSNGKTPRIGQQLPKTVSPGDFSSEGRPAHPTREFDCGVSDDSTESHCGSGPGTRPQAHMPHVRMTVARVKEETPFPDVLG